MRKFRPVFSIALVICGLAAASFHTPAKKFADGKIKTLVLDAGHGGKDPGCHGKEAKEKDVTLSIVTKLNNILKEKNPEIKVVLTRDDDTFVELHNRAGTCSPVNADFFISVHCNANESSVPYGTETYIMGLHKTEANLDVVMRENKAILLEDDHVVKYDGFDPENVLSYIFFSNLADDYLVQSSQLASNVEKQFKDRVGRHSRGVKQAGYLVLWKAARPAILIETGFLTNAEEEKFLNSETGQDYIASAIYRSIRDYNDSME